MWNNVLHRAGSWREWVQAAMLPGYEMNFAVLARIARRFIRHTAFFCAALRWQRANKPRDLLLFLCIDGAVVQLNNDDTETRQPRCCEIKIGINCVLQSFPVARFLSFQFQSIKERTNLYDSCVSGVFIFAREQDMALHVSLTVSDSYRVERIKKSLDL